MNTTAMLVAAIAVLPAFGLAAWSWLAVASASDEWRTFAGFEGMRLED